MNRIIGEEILDLFVNDYPEFKSNHLLLTTYGPDDAFLLVRNLDLPDGDSIVAVYDSKKSINIKNSWIVGAELYDLKRQALKYYETTPEGF